MARTTNVLVSRVFGILLICVLLLIQEGDAYEFKVGGSTGWTLPKDPNAAAFYNRWAETYRFQIGDALLFVYAAGHDSVLHVTKDDYTNCKTGAPLEKFTDGHTAFKFNQSGAHYFISGVANNCHKNEKLVVIVMADRSKNNTNGPAATPSPSPSSDKVSPPSPAPAGEESPSPPSPGTDINPSLAPSQQSSPPKNGASSIDGASSIVAGVVGTIVTGFLGSSLVLGF